MARPITRRAGLLAAFAVALLGACGDQGVPLHEDAELSAKLQSLQRSGGTARLKDLTGGDWDTVHIFPNPVSREWVEEDVGTRIDMGDFWATGHILVFVKDGQVQRAVYTHPTSLRYGQYSDRAILGTARPGSPTLEVVEDRQHPAMPLHFGDDPAGAVRGCGWCARVVRDRPA